MRKNCIIQNEGQSKNNILSPSIGFIKKNIFFNDLSLFQQRKEIDFEILKQMDFGNKNVNNQFNDLTKNRGDTKSKKLENVMTDNGDTKNKILEKQESPFVKLYFKPLFIGSDFKYISDMFI